jgi:hypothetical protein
LKAVTKELNKIKLERKKGKNIQKKAKKGKKTELTALSKEFLKNRKEGIFEKAKKSIENGYKRIE